MKSKQLYFVLAASVLTLGACGVESIPSISSSSVPASSSEVVSSSEAPVSSSEVVSSSEAPVSSSEEESSEIIANAGEYTYKTYTAVSPSNWNELTYQDSNDTQIMSYISGSFFTFNYKFDNQGKILDGQFTVDYDGATALTDVTTTYAGQYNVPSDATSQYAYKITLRQDLKWDDGTQIKAEDFVYTMKEQENPLFMNYRADSYYNGSTVIANAKNYLFQGQTGWYDARTIYGENYDSTNDSNMIFTAKWDDTKAPNYIMSYIVNKGYASKAAFGKYGLVYILNALWGGLTVTEDQLAEIEGKTYAEIKNNDSYSAIFNTLASWWCSSAYEVMDFFILNYTWPAVDFNQVGLFKGATDYELIMVLDKGLDLLKADGSLNYKAAYNLSSLPLVKRDLYEANKVAPAGEGAYWTSKYNSSKETTASWGPYKLTNFQAGKSYTLEKNDKWYGYNMPEYAGQYQTTKIYCETIAEWNTAWLKFQKGDLSTIGINVTISADYKNSSRAVFTADDYVDSLQLQSNGAALKNRETAGVDKEMLTYQDFRNAISLAIDRADFAAKCTTASLAGLGLFNSMHYYDVANGGVYRDTDVAKEAICAAYGVDLEDYDNLDQAYAAVTGYDLTLARQLLNAAYAQAIEAGTISATDRVVLTYGTSVDNENTRRNFNYLKAAIEKLAEGTSLEGRLTLEFDASFGSTWANDFRGGAYDICEGGWSGAAWDPGYFLLAYLSPDYMYSKSWDTANEMLEYNPWGDNVEAHELEMSLLDWYYYLNGNPQYASNFSADAYTAQDGIGEDGYCFFWGEGQIETSFRLGIIAQLEQAILEAYYTVPLYNAFGASLVSYKFNYISTTYNTFMGYGGVRYATYNYDDAQWETVKSSFDYKN